MVINQLHLMQRAHVCLHDQQAARQYTDDDAGGAATNNDPIEVPRLIL